MIWLNKDITRFDDDLMMILMILNDVGIVWGCRSTKCRLGPVLVSCRDYIGTVLGSCCIGLELCLSFLSVILGS